MEDVKKAIGEWMRSYSPEEIAFASEMIKTDSIPFSVCAGFYGGYQKGKEAAQGESEKLRKALKSAYGTVHNASMLDDSFQRLSEINKALNIMTQALKEKKDVST